MTHASLNVIAAKRVTSVIPIVFTAMGDPVGIGVVASLARPGGNATGFRCNLPILRASDWNCCARSFPRSPPLAILVNADSPNATVEVSEVRAAVGRSTLRLRYWNQAGR